jgi:outer membrane biogenesis lipoprotein LolB
MQYFALWALAALLLTACAQTSRNAASMRDDTQNIDHPDRGMRDSHTM